MNNNEQIVIDTNDVEIKCTLMNIKKEKFEEIKGKSNYDHHNDNIKNQPQVEFDLTDDDLILITQIEAKTSQDSSIGKKAYFNSININDPEVKPLISLMKEIRNDYSVIDKHKTALGHLTSNISSRKNKVFEHQEKILYNESCIHKLNNEIAGLVKNSKTKKELISDKQSTIASKLEFIDLKIQKLKRPELRDFCNFYLENQTENNNSITDSTIDNTQLYNLEISSMSSTQFSSTITSTAVSSTLIENHKTNEDENTDDQLNEAKPSQKNKRKKLENEEHEINYKKKRTKKSCYSDIQKSF